MLVNQKMCFTCYLQAVNTNAPEEKTKHETYTSYIDSRRARILKITANNKRHSYFNIHCSLSGTNFLHKLFGKCINSRDQIFKFKMSILQYFHLNCLLINARHSTVFSMLPNYQPNCTLLAVTLL